jgi:WW domain
MTAAGTELPAGWQECKTSEGKLYYFHPASGKSTWVKPGRKLPEGWKEIKTPDGRSFYVHDAFQLSTWDCPGQQPSDSKSAQPNQGKSAQPSQGKGMQSSQQFALRKSVSTTGNATERSLTNKRVSNVVTGVGIAAKLSSSTMDIASDPIMGTTKAVTKGVILAAKNLKNNKKARKMLSRVGVKGMSGIAQAALALGGDDDGGDIDFGDDNDGDDVNGDAGDEEYIEPTNGDSGPVDYSGSGYGNGYGYPQQDIVYDPGFVQPQAPPMFGDPFMQEPGADACGQVSNAPDYHQEVPTPLVNNITIVEENETCNTFVDQSAENQYIDQSTQNYVDQSVNSQYIDQSTQNYIDHSFDNQYIDQSTQNYVENSQYISNVESQQSEMVSVENANVENNGLAQNNIGPIATPAPEVFVPETEYNQWQPLPPEPTADYFPPDGGQAPLTEQQAPGSLVFEPILAAPMMVEPPASSDGLIFVPQYPATCTSDSSAALALI